MEDQPSRAKVAKRPATLSRDVMKFNTIANKRSLKNWPSNRLGSVPYATAPKGCSTTLPGSLGELDETWNTSYAVWRR